MKLLLLLLFLVSSFLSVSQNWVQQADIPTDGRDDAISFSVLGLGYIVTGNMGSQGNRLWCFDPSTNSWSEKSTFPGQERQYAGTFVLNDKAYMMCGYSSTNTPLKDVWQYDPSKDSWKQMKDFEGAPRWTSFNFTADNVGFIGAGASPDSSLADCWKYYPEKDAWTQISDYPGGRMREVLGFSIGDHCFAGTGLNVDPLVFHNDFYKYDSKTDTWEAIADFPGTARSYMGGIGVGTKAIVGGGWAEGGDFKTEFYSLSLTGKWESVASAPIQGWRGMSTFSIDKSVYFLSGLYEDITKTSNVFSLTPTQEYYPHLFPNPSDEVSYLYFKPNHEVQVFNLNGDLVETTKTAFDGYCRLPELASGEYLIRLNGSDSMSYTLRWVVR